MEQRDPHGDWRDQFERLGREWRGNVLTGQAFLALGAIVAYFQSGLGIAICTIGLGTLLVGVGRLVLALLEVNLWKVDP